MQAFDPIELTRRKPAGFHSVNSPGGEDDCAHFLARLPGKAARVCVVGNAAIDLSVRVACLPQLGETVLALETISDFGGKGANQAVVAARAGAATQLFSALGCDADGDRILARLIDDGVNTAHMARLSCATDLSIVTVDARAENTIVTRNDAAARYRPDARTLLDATHAGDWIVLQGNLSAQATADVLYAARRNQRRTLFNPGPVRLDSRSMLASVDVLVVNRGEAAALSALDDPLRAAAALYDAGAREVLVTLGADGVIWSNDSGARSVAAVRAEVVDTVGAGDAFCGTLVAALAQGFPMPLALRWALSVAALTVTRRGAQASFPDRATMRELRDSLLNPLPLP